MSTFDGSQVVAPVVTSTIWWWQELVAEGDLVAGVFEGGGAKGILYEGALKAMLDRARPRWFCAVAGSSAGAITALLVAAGLRPDDIASETKAAIGTLQMSKPWVGLQRLRSGRGYLDSTELKLWLRRVLSDQFKSVSTERPDEVTFKELHDLTGIVLHIVAVDIATRRPVVFDYIKSPHDQVVEAVVASAAIPFVFNPVHKADLVLVDGGVGTNFPRFVFDDLSYRHHLGLEPMTAPIVGFLLDEQRPYPRDPKPHGLLSYVCAAFALTQRIFLQWLPRLFGLNKRFPVAGYPRPRSSAAGAVLDLVDSVMMFFRSMKLLATSAVILTIATIVGAYYALWRPLGRSIAELTEPGGLSGWGVILTLLLLLLAPIPVYALIIALATIAVGVHVWPIGRQIGYGLGHTFLTTPGAPEWTGAAPTDYVARLPVPHGLTTLASTLNDDDTARAQVCAGKKTAEVLNRLDRHADVVADAPLVMVNLLKFKPFAEYPDGTDSHVTGREAYARYGEVVRTLIEALGGRIRYAGEVTGPLLGDVEDIWDAVALAEYPSLAAFQSMVMSPEMHAIEHHRAAGLAGQLNFRTKPQF